MKKNKACTIGTSCGNTCIESGDKCKVKLKSKKVIDQFHSKVKISNNKKKGGFNDAQTKAYDDIMRQATELFTSPAASEMFRDAAKNFESKDDVKLLGNIRHRLEGGRYDKILDNARAESGLDAREWSKVYNSAKNRLNGMMAKELLKSKGNCAG